MGAANLGASFFINLMTVTAEIGGVALALQLATDVGPLLWVPVAAFGVWLVIWRVRFSLMENGEALLRKYWDIPERQIETSCVLGKKMKKV